MVLKGLKAFVVRTKSLRHRGNLPWVLHRCLCWRWLRRCVLERWVLHWCVLWSLSWWNRCVLWCGRLIAAGLMDGFKPRPIDAPPECVGPKIINGSQLLDEKIAQDKEAAFWRRREKLDGSTRITADNAASFVDVNLQGIPSLKEYRSEAKRTSDSDA